MGIIKGSGATFTRFRIIDPISDELWQEIPSKLKKFAITDIDELAEERAFGWTNIDDMLDTEFHRSTPEKGAYLAFSLRLDTRRVPPAVLNKHFTIALREEEEKNKEEGKKFISRERRKEIKEQVKFRLMQRYLPIPAVFDVVWNIQSNYIYLGSTQSKIIEMFGSYFTETFDLHLEIMTPYDLASTFLSEELMIGVDTIESTNFV